jgi:hypothetical protein
MVERITTFDPQEAAQPPHATSYPEAVNPAQAGLSDRIGELANRTLGRIGNWMPELSGGNLGRLGIATLALTGASHLAGHESSVEATQQPADFTLTEVCPPNGEVNGNYGASATGTQQGVSLLAEFKAYDRNNKLIGESSLTIKSTGPSTQAQVVPNGAGINPEDGKVTVKVNQAWNDSDISPAAYNPEQKELVVDCLPGGGTTATTTPPTPTTVATAPPATTEQVTTSSVPATTAPRPTTTIKAVAPAPAAETTTIPPTTTPPTTIEVPPTTNAAITPSSVVSTIETPLINPKDREAKFVANQTSLQQENSNNKNRDKAWGIAAILAGVVAVGGAAGLRLRRKSTATSTQSEEPLTPRHA